MIEVVQNVSNAEELCECVIEHKKELRGTKVGKFHKLMGAGQKTIMLVSKTEKEFVAYDDVMNQKTHFGKLLHKIFFEEDTEETAVDVDETLKSLMESMTPSQLAELCEKLQPVALPNRLDFEALFQTTKDYSEEIKDAIDRNKDQDVKTDAIFRGFGLLDAIGVEYEEDLEKWEVRRLPIIGTWRFALGNICIRIAPQSEIRNELLTTELKYKSELFQMKLSRSDYGDILFKRDIDDNVEMIVVINDY